MENLTKYALVDTDGHYYAEHGLDITTDISAAMKFDTQADADRVRVNLNSRFVLPFESVKVTGEPRGQHGRLWHAATCEYCGRMDAAMEDPTFDAAKVLPGGRDLWICEVCAKEKIESEMMRLGQVIH